VKFEVFASGKKNNRNLTARLPANKSSFVNPNERFFFGNFAPLYRFVRALQGENTLSLKDSPV